MNRTAATAAFASASATSPRAPSPARSDERLPAQRIQTNVASHVDGSQPVQSDEQWLNEHVEIDVAVQLGGVDPPPDPVEPAQQRNDIRVATTEQGVRAAHRASVVELEARYPLAPGTVRPGGAPATSGDKSRAHVGLTAIAATHGTAP